jgi:hypothetical protein
MPTLTTSYWTYNIAPSSESPHWEKYTPDPSHAYDLREITSSWWNFSHTDVERIGTTIPAALKTGRLNMGTNVIRKRYHSASVVAQTTGTTLDASISLNGGAAVQRTSIDMGINRIAEDAISNNWLLWNLGYWAPSDGGDFKWAGTQTYAFKSHKRFPTHTKGINAQLALHTDHAQDMRISGAHLYYIPLRGAH